MLGAEARAARPLAERDQSVPVGHLTERDQSVPVGAAGRARRTRHVAAQGRATPRVPHLQAARFRVAEGLKPPPAAFSLWAQPGPWGSKEPWSSVS